MATKNLRKVKAWLASGKLAKFIIENDPTVRWPVNFEKALKQLSSKDE